jgi:hypothetical protein
MAWIQCKTEAVDNIKAAVKTQGSIRKALKLVSEDSGIPIETLKNWLYPNKQGNYREKKELECGQNDHAWKHGLDDAEIQQIDKDAQQQKIIAANEIKELKRNQKRQSHQEVIDDTPPNTPSKLLVYDVWNPLPFLTNKIRHPGNIPQEYIENLVYYYTDEGDLVYDPFAGGGPTIDVCERMNREYYVSDIAPIDGRPEIKKWDLNDGIPDDLPPPKLTFLDPPYYKKKADDYVEESISSLDIHEYLEFFDKLTTDLFNLHIIGTYVAFLMSNYVDYDEPLNSIWIDDYVSLFMNAGFEIYMKMQVPHSPSQYQAFHVQRAKENKQLLVLSRDLIIFTKEEN